MAVYQEIAQSLEQDIRQNLRSGDYLPSEAELARRFAVNRHTLRRAVDQLVDAGMLLRRHGKGTLVLEHALEYSIAARGRFSEALSALGHPATSEVIGRKVLVADDRLAGKSRIPAGTPLLQVDTLRSLDGRAVCLISHYLRRTVFPVLEREYRLGSLHAFIEERYGIRMRRRQGLIAATLPNQREAQLLDYPRHMPLLVVKSQNVRAGTDEVLEYSVSRSRADCFEYKIQPQTIQVNDIPTGENPL
jgi:GntR family phosphonate transport system transcriptional regulator